MKIQSLIAFTTLIAFACATNQPIVRAEEDEAQLEALESHGHEDKASSNNKEYGFFGVPWAVPDFVAGITMGSYGPVNSRTRDGDCFSKWYDWGITMIGLSDFFTKPFEVKDWKTWVSVIIYSGSWGYSTYNLIDRCIEDLDVAEQLHWNHHYGFKAEDVSIPKVGG